MADTKNYTAVTISYWGFTLTDGALRMLVLLHFHTLGFSPLDIAFLFLLYEATGIITNFFGGLIGAKFGLRCTLLSGLIIQILALIMLAAVPSGLTLSGSVLYVMLSQALSGVAKDLTKMSSKSAIKVIVPDKQQGILFKWVSILTGSKNALKGIGFFLGGFLLYSVGFINSLLIMAGALFIIFGVVAFAFKFDIGKAKSEITTKELFSKSKEINFLCLARVFLFSSRDVWFVVGLPIFLSDIFSWNHNEVGSFMALWIIGYGIVQAFVPQLLKNVTNLKKAVKEAKIWCFILVLIPAVIAWGLSPYGDDFVNNKTNWIIVGLFIFGIVFAINSSLHSYLIVAYSNIDKVALTVGFYYMANAAGRLIGTLLSGVIYQYYGFIMCLITSTILLFMAALFTLPLCQSKET